MSFINPIEILNLQDVGITHIDSGVIKKAKRILFAEIDLSDNLQLEYKGRYISRSDCEYVINELESKEKIEVYYFIANNPDLNNFLAVGKNDIFSSFRQESIYKLPEFLSIVSTYFSERYDRALLKAYQNDDGVLFKKILSLNPPIKNSDRDNLYKSISTFIRQNVGEIDSTVIDIKNEESTYDKDNIDSIYLWVQEKLDAEKINLLPQYFQSTRNNCAQSVRNLSVNVFNSFNDADTSVDLLSYALTFEIDGLTKQKLKEDYTQLDQIKEKRDAESRLEPILRKYASFIIDSRLKIDGLKNKTLSVTAVRTWVNSTIDVSQVNNLGPEFDEIRNQIALVLRVISVETWNSYNDINSAIFFINQACGIGKLNTATYQNITEAKNRLNDLNGKIQLRQQPVQKTVTSPYRPSTVSKTTTSSDNSGCLWLGGIVAIILIIVFISNSSKPTSSSDNYSNYRASNSNSNSTSYDPPTTTSTPSTPAYSEPIQRESQYKGNQLRDGASPLDKCFGKGRYSGQAWINFDNSNSSDAIVCLVSVTSNKTIRNEYIRAGSNFRMNNIPSGTYYLKVYYGNDWNPTLKNFCDTKGAFETDAHFSKSDGYNDYINVENSDYSYTTGSITLYSVPNGNMSTQSTSESDFFNK